MIYSWFANLLFVALTAAAVGGDQRTTSEKHNPATAYIINGTTSPITKTVKTTDFRNRDAIISMPALTFLGHNNGNIFKCLFESPNECELLYEAGSSITSLVVSGEYLYASLVSGVILKCELANKNSCGEFHKFNQRVTSLAVIDGYLYACVHNEGILSCELNQPHNCQPLQTYNSTIEASALYGLGKDIYIGHINGDTTLCSLRTANSCTVFYNTPNDVAGIASISKKKFILSRFGDLWHCTWKSDRAQCKYSFLGRFQMHDLAPFQGLLYIVTTGGVYVCEPKRDTICTNYVHNRFITSIAFAYATYEMQQRYKNEQSSCTGQSSKCPPYVTYYEPHHRAAFELHVKDGKLRNHMEDLVDTTHANSNQSGTATIFAMGPDGKLLLSNAQEEESIHTSSLFAGNPVSGAGEMVVNKGVIVKMTTCSKHYRPDLALNLQVVDSLRSQGYTDPIDLQTCCEGDACGQVLDKNPYQFT